MDLNAVISNCCNSSVEAIGTRFAIAIVAMSSLVAWLKEAGEQKVLEKGRAWWTSATQVSMVDKCVKMWRRRKTKRGLKGIDVLLIHYVIRDTYVTNITLTSFSKLVVLQLGLRVSDTVATQNCSNDRSWPEIQSSEDKRPRRQDEIPCAANP